MAEVRIDNETEDHEGWTFRLSLAADDAGPASRHTLRLAWADYDLWSGDGADPPHAVAAAVIEFLLSRQRRDDLPPRVDASLARRQFPDADEKIPLLIRR